MAPLHAKRSQTGQGASATRPYALTCRVNMAGHSGGKIFRGGLLVVMGWIGEEVDVLGGN